MDKLLINAGILFLASIISGIGAYSFSTFQGMNETIQSLAIAFLIFAAIALLIGAGLLVALYYSYPHPSGT